MSGQGSGQFNSYMGGLVGGEYENPDRILTGQVDVPIFWNLHHNYFLGIFCLFVYLFAYFHLMGIM